MKEILLTQGQVALVDDEDFQWLNQFKWHASKMGNVFYAIRRPVMVNGKQQMMIRMHHEVIGQPPKNFVNDHKNGNGLDNRRNNLRHVTVRQNQQNQKNRKQSSRYPGVCWHKRDKKWRVQIVINGKRKYLGNFADEFKAFNAYKQAVEVLGEEIIKDF